MHAIDDLIENIQDNQCTMNWPTAIFAIIIIFAWAAGVAIAESFMVKVIAFFVPLIAWIISTGWVIDLITRTTG